MKTQKQQIKYKFLLQNCSILLLGILMIIATSCSDDSITGSDDSDGFVESWSVENWSESGIEGGTTQITGSADSLILSYDVNLDTDDGVSHRTAIFQIEVPASGTVEFDWEYTGYHSFYRAFAELTLRSESATNVLLDNESTSSSFTFTGKTSIYVTEGQTLEFEVGGSNYDTDTRLRGNVVITNFRLIP